MSDPITPTNTDLGPTYLNDPNFQALKKYNPQLAAQLESTESVQQLDEQFPLGTSANPVLPNVKLNNSALAFSTMSQATLYFGQTINATITAQQRQQQNLSLAAAQEAILIGQQITALNNEIASDNNQAQTSTTSIQNEVNNAASQTGAQQSQITSVNSTINSGAFGNVNTAYNTFSSAVSALPGVTTNPDGSYSLASNAPQSTVTAFNNALSVYNIAVTIYNNALTSIGNYNTATSSYNTNVTNNNTDFNNFVTTNGLSAFFMLNNINLTQTSGSTIDINGYSMLTTPVSVPAGGSGPTPPPTITAPSTVSTIPNYEPVGGTGTTLPPGVKNEIITLVFGAKIAQLTNQLNSTVAYFQFLQSQLNNTQVISNVADPLANTKPISQKILPSTVITAARPARTPMQAGATGFMTAAVGLTQPHVLGILGKANLVQVINNFNLDISDTRLQQIVSSVQTFLIGQIAANSNSAIAPTINELNNNTNSNTLTPSNPVFGLTFAIAVAGTTLAATGNENISGSAVNAFIQSIQELKNLTPEQKAQLTSAINLSQLEVALKLLEVNLGLPELSSQVLLPLLPSDLAETVLTDAAQQNNITQQQLQSNLNQHFISEGYNQSQSAFLAQTGVELSAQLLAPTPTNINANNTDQQLLQDSLAASLILSNNNLSVQTATNIAETTLNAIQQNNQDQNATSVTTFKAQLASELRQQGIKNSIAEQVANEVVIVSSSLPLTPTTDTNTSAQRGEQFLTPKTVALALNIGPESPRVQLNQSELSNLVHAQVSRLLAPSLGIEYTKEVTQTIAKTLFGTPTPDSSDIADVKLPHSIVGAVQRHIKNVVKENDIQSFEAVASNFRDTIQAPYDLNKFLTSSMAAAYPIALTVTQSGPTQQHGLNQTSNPLEINV